MDEGGEQIRLRVRDRTESSLPMVVRSLDPATGTMQETSTGGRGCVVEDDYLTVLGNSKSLVAFRGGDLDSARVVAEHFDPFGDDRSFVLHSCGRYNGSLVLALETARDGE